MEQVNHALYFAKKSLLWIAIELLIAIIEITWEEAEKQSSQILVFQYIFHCTAHQTPTYQWYYISATVSKNGMSNQGRRAEKTWFA